MRPGDRSRGSPSTPRFCTSGPTQPCQVLAISGWSSPWFHANPAFCFAAARVRVGARDAHPSSKKKSALPNSVNVGSRSGSAFCMCRICSSCWSAMLSVIGVGPLSIGSHSLSAAHLALEVAHAARRSAGLALDQDRRGVVEVLVEHRVVAGRCPAPGALRLTSVSPTLLPYGARRVLTPSQPGFVRRAAGEVVALVDGDQEQRVGLVDALVGEALEERGERGVVLLELLDVAGLARARTRCGRSGRSGRRGRLRGTCR